MLLKYSVLLSLLFLCVQQPACSQNTISTEQQLANLVVSAVVDSHGFDSAAGSNTLILVDDQRLNNTDIGSPGLATTFLKGVESIEVIQGSVGALLSDQAVIGVIKGITESPGDFALIAG